MSFTALKDPQADLDYTIDWSAWLAGDRVLTSTWTATAGSGITIHDESIDTPGQKTTVWMSGGKSGVFGVTNHITTSAARQDERSIMVTVQNR